MAKRMAFALSGKGLSIFVLLAVGAALVGLGVVVQPSNAPRTEGPGIAALRVSTGEVVWQDSYSVKRSFVGRVEAQQESEVGFEIPGMVARFLSTRETRCAPATCSRPLMLHD